MKTKVVIYHISTYVGNYEVHGTGFTREEAINSAWKTYRKNGFDDFTRKSEWVKYHWGNDPYCDEFAVGDGWLN